MGMTPGGTCNLLSALKEVFENGTCVPGNGTSGEGECKMAEPAPIDPFPVGVKSEHYLE